MNDNWPVHAYCLHQHKPGEDHFANYFCPLRYHRANHQQWSCTKYPICTLPQSIFPQSSPTSIQSPITPRVVKTKDWNCCICSKSFHRQQERDIHEKTHLPHFIHCPLPHCAWRGNRIHLFKTHWQQDDHLPYHRHYGRAPEGSEIETYDPCAILSQLRSGAISLSGAKEQATVLVQVKAYELQKPNMWADSWGRNRKQASSCGTKTGKHRYLLRSATKGSMPQQE